MSILTLLLAGYGVMCVLAAVFVASAAISNRIRNVPTRDIRDRDDRAIPAGNAGSVDRGSMVAQ